MKRIVTEERNSWIYHAESHGFKFHTMYGEPYWNEGVHYAFNLRQIEDDLEDPSTELHNMCMNAVNKVMASEELLTKLGIPEASWDYVRNSWDKERHNNLYGRFDLIYDGESSAKMIEYNADTPTSLWEAAVYQWLWLEDAKHQGLIGDKADQFNLIQERLVERFNSIGFADGKDMYFSSFKGSEEDYATVEYLGYCALEAGITPWHINVQDISVTEDNQFCTKEGKSIERIFMLYPWEDMLRDDFAQYLPLSNTEWIEPAWKSIVSNKGIMAVLWEMYKGHPNLLPTYFEEDAPSMGSYVRKPIFSREGSSIEMYDGNGNPIAIADDMSYKSNNAIVQEYAPIKNFDGNYPVLGTWIVGDECVGLGVREDRSKITQDLSRFTPHIFEE